MTMMIREIRDDKMMHMVGKQVAEREKRNDDNHQDRRRALELDHRVQ